MAAKPKATSQQKQMTPLWIISLFVSLTETTLGISLTQTTGGIQTALTGFVIAFPLVVAGAFFIVLWHRPYVLYSPGEYGNIDVSKFIGALSQKRFATLVKETADIKSETKVIGNPDQFQLLFKVSGESWKKSTKAMQVKDGCLVQVTSEQLNPDGSVSSAEAVTYVPGTEIRNDSEGDGRHLCPKKEEP